MNAPISLQPDLAQARHFLDALAPGETITFQTFDDDKKRKNARLTRVLHGTLEEQSGTLTLLNQQGAGVFMMANAGDSAGRTAANVQRVRALFVDLDGAPLKPVQAFRLPPHIICESSVGRYHAYWRVTDCPLPEFKALQQSLAACFAGDPSVNDLPRVMRLPGFYHHKAAPTLTTLRSVGSHDPYAMAQIKHALSQSPATRDVNADAMGGIRLGIDPNEPCPEGQRNNRLASLVGRWIGEGKTFDDVTVSARNWNQRSCRPPLDDIEVMSVCNSIWGKHERERRPTVWQGGTAVPEATPTWDTPILFTEHATPAIPARLLPGLFGEFAEALALATETEESMSVFAVLGSLSTALAKRFAVSPWAGWIEPINIYTLIALPPANNKSMVVNRCTQPLSEWEISQATALGPELKMQRSEQKNQEKLIESLRVKAVREADPGKQASLFRAINDLEAKLPELQCLPQLFASDATPESLATSVHEQAGRFAIISDEGGIVEIISGLYTGGNANIDVILKGIDGGETRVLRKDRSIDLRPYLTFLMVVQPGIVQNMGERRAFKGNGLLERFLYVLPASRLGYRTLDTPPVPAAVQTAYNHAMRTLLDLRPIHDFYGLEQPRVLTLAPDAEGLFRKFRGAIEQELRPEGSLSSCLGWGGKLAGYTLRLAGLLHVAKHGDGDKIIALETMEHAALLGFLLIGHARAAFHLMGIDQASDDAKAVYDWIKRRGQAAFARTECHRELHGRFIKRERLTAALMVLNDRNIVRGPEERITTPGKRATKIYRVNPLVTGEQ